MIRWIAALLSCAALAGIGLPSTTASADEVQQDEGTEKVVSIDEIPAPARRSLLREAAGAPIQRVEQETAHGQTVYEGVVKKGNEMVGITVDGNGKVVGAHIEKDEGSEHGD